MTGAQPPQTDRADSAIVPRYDVPEFPGWAVDLADRVRRIGEATGDTREADDEDRYEGPMFCGMIFRPAMTSGGKTLGYRLATIDEAKAWNDQYPRWHDMVCACGHSREQHRNLWDDEADEITGESCEDCDCTTENGRSGS